MSEVKIDITSEIHRSKEDLAAVNKGLDRLATKAEKADDKMQRLGDRAVAVGKKMTLFVTVPILAAAGATIKLGMDAVESRNLFEVSMGAMTQAADKWSAHLSDKMGINRYESQRLIGTFNVMLKSLGQNEKGAYDMAKGLAELGYDMASFFNLEPEEAFDKLRSAITGETEPLKRLGIVVNETTIKQWALNKGLIEQGQVLTENQKITARYNVIMERTTAAHGDMERTLDSPANKLRVLKSRITETATEIGIKLLPTFEKMLGHIEKMVKWFSDLSEANKKQIMTLMGIAAAAGPVMIAFGKFIKIAPAVGKAFTLMTGPLGIVVAAAAAVGLAIDQLVKKSMEASDVEMDAMVDSEKAMRGFWDFRTKSIEDGTMDLETWKEIYEKHGKDYKRVMVAIANLPEYQHIRDAWAEQSKTVEEKAQEIINSVDNMAMIAKMRLLELQLEMDAWKIPKLIKSPEELMQDIGFTDLDETFNMEWDKTMHDSEERSNEWLNNQIVIANGYGDANKKMLEGTEKEEIKFADAAMAIGSELAGHSKAVGYAKAVISTAAGAAKAIETYAPPLSLIMAAIQIAAGMKQIQVISGQTIPSAAEGGILPRDMMVQVHKEELIAPQPMIKEIFREVIREKEMSPIIVRVYIGADELEDRFIDIVQSRADTGELELPGKAID